MSGEDMITVGTYKARAVKGSEQYSPDKNGNLLLGLDLQIEGGDFEGASMTVTLSFSGKAGEYSMKKLRMLGWAGTDVTDLAGVDANAVDVRVYDEEFNGTSRRKMEITYGGGSFKFQNQCDDRQKKAFAQQLRGLAASIPAGKRGGDDFPASFGGPGAGNGTGRPQF